MNGEQAALWEQLRAFSFDDPQTVNQFSMRLARENRWSRTFTRRVIEEYRRFLFLSVAAGHPISPSESVDQAWHLHLIYTRSYWDDLCGRVLKQPLHHLPSVGGTAEQQKLADWYSRTLASYERLFGERPPTDIWPSSAERDRQKVRHVHVDAEQAWIVPKPQLRGSGRSLLAIALLLIVVAVLGCVPLLAVPAIGPLDWKGSDFLIFYVGLLATAVAIGIGWRMSIRGFFAARQPVPEADPIEIAYLAGGEQRAILAVVASMVARNHLQVSGKSVAQAESLPSNATDIERAVWDAVGDNGLLKTLPKQVHAKASLLGERLEEAGLVLPLVDQWKARFVPAALLALLLVFGLMKIAVGLERNRPIGFLCGLVFFTGLVAWLFLKSRPIRTTHGDEVLGKLERENESLKSMPSEAQNALFQKESLEGSSIGAHPGAFAAAATLPLAFALFGPVALANGPLDDYRKALRPNQPGTSGSSCSSGCGGVGGSCGGGGGGGGDGGGGGGCGGGGSGCGGCGGGGGGD